MKDVRVFIVRYFFWNLLKKEFVIYFFVGVWNFLIGWIKVIRIRILMNVNLIGVKNFLIILIIFVGLREKKYVILKNIIVNRSKVIELEFLEMKGLSLILKEILFVCGIVNKGLIVR